MSEFIGHKDIDINNFDWVQNLEDHMILYSNWKDSPIIRNMMEKQSESLTINSHQSLKLESMDDLRVQARRLQQIGFDVYYKDLTMDEIKPLGIVYKVIVPQMMPLSQHNKIRWLSSLLCDGKTLININSYPQPFS